MGYHKLIRPVSIIGVGSTPFGTSVAMDSAAGLEVKEGEKKKAKTFTSGDLTFQEMCAWAAQDALKDAGIEAKDVDKVVFGQVASYSHTGKQFTPHAYVLDWIGMSGKRAVHHEEACATGYYCIQEAAIAVASGECDIAMVLSADQATRVCDPLKPPHMTSPVSDYEDVVGTWFVPPFSVLDPYHARFTGGRMFLDQDARYYYQEYGLTRNQIDEAMNAMVISNRRNAARNPRAMQRIEFAEIAKQHGFNSAMDYLKSEEQNRHVSEFLRRWSFLSLADGAGATIICSSDVAKGFKEKPIEILGMGYSTKNLQTPHFMHECTDIAFEQAYETSGVRPEEIDYLQCTDMCIAEQLVVAEQAGYLPKGKGWQYVIDGRTAFDGDKPINTNGGATSFGHAYAGSGPAHLAECVWQMRGQAGERQIKNAPRTVMLRGEGGGQTATAMVLRTQD